jgi:glycosyltransferase involved in cell wall biosynthesis
VWERHAWPYGSAAGHVLEVNAPLARERGAPREREAEHRAVRSAFEVVVVSRWLAAWAVDEVGCDPARVRHVPNGTSSVRGDRDATRARLDLRGPVVGFLGSMRRWHGADRLPEILEALGPAWTGLAVGDGPAPPVDHPRLVRTGQVPETTAADLVAAMDVAIAPYRTDAPPWFCPLKILAYRAQGVPVVGTDVGDVPLLVGNAGRAVASDDPDAWAHAIRSALELPRLRSLRTWRHVVREVLGPS